MKLIFEKECPLSSLPSLAKDVAKELMQNQHFQLALVGQMGAGKTTLTRHLLQEFGLSKNLPVPSPTYTYLNQYALKDKLFCHVDMYRSETCPFRTAEELFGGKVPDGVFVEWPEQGADIFRFTHQINIEPVDHAKNIQDTVRKFTFQLV